MDVFSAILASLRLASPLVLLLAPLPWLLVRWRRRGALASAPAGAIRLPQADVLPRGPAPRRSRSLSAPGLLVFALLLIAAARPQWIETADQRPVTGRDLLLLLDVSASMQTRDLQDAGQAVSRLAAATRFGRAFLNRRPGDRVGLIVFASRPYLYVPLSYDLSAIGAALDAAAAGLAGEKTALGDALGMAARTLGGDDGAASAPAGAVAVLLSDGANTAGSLSPQQAGWLAAQRRVRVHALGVGASPDETALRAVADQTGGIYARATNAAAVGEFFDRLDRLEPLQRVGGPVVAVARDLYAVPLSLALLVGLLAVLPALLPGARPRRAGTDASPGRVAE